MSSMNATEPVEAAVVVILERLGEGEPVEKESNRQGTMRIRADTRRAPTRMGRRTLGAPLVCSVYRRIYNLLSYYDRGNRVCVHAGTSDIKGWFLEDTGNTQGTKHKRTRQVLVRSRKGTGSSVHFRGLYGMYRRRSLGPLPGYIGPLPCYSGLCPVRF